MTFKSSILAHYFVIADSLKVGDAYDYEDVVKSAKKFGNPDILHDSYFSHLFKPGQKFILQRIPVAKIHNKGKKEYEVPSKPLIFEGASEDEEYAQEYAKEHPNGDSAGPIIVKPDGDKYQVVDGRHRSRAAFLRGEKDIRAFVAVMGE